MYVRKSLLLLHRKKKKFFSLQVKWILSHIKNTSAEGCDTSKGKWEANPLVNGGKRGSRDCGMLEGHNGPDNQPTECPSFFPAGGVGGDRALELVDAS